MTRNNRSAMTAYAALAALALSGGDMRAEPRKPVREPRPDKHPDSHQGSRERARRMRQLERRKSSAVA